MSNFTSDIRSIDSRNDGGCKNEKRRGYQNNKNFILIFALLLVCVHGDTTRERKNIVELSASELTALRDSIYNAQVQGLWTEIAGDHGLPNAMCPHGNYRFVVWHRRFMKRIEDILGQAMPYWDWAQTSPEQLPHVFMERSYVSGNGVLRANPLYAGIKPDASFTTRSVIESFPTTQLRESEALALAATTFTAFSNRLEEAHNTLHGSIGGDMNSLDYAAFDPVFWLHHMNVDRIFYRWQLRYPNAEYPQLATGLLSDSAGVFSGRDIIDDMSGWTTLDTTTVTPTATATPTAIPTISTLTPSTTTNGESGATTLTDTTSPSVVLPTSMSNININNALNLNNVVSDELNSALLGQSLTDNAITDSSSSSSSLMMMMMDNALISETHAEPTSYHLIMSLLQLPSSVEPMRLEVQLDNVCVGNIYLFGTGQAGQAYHRDAMLDITCGYTQICPYTNTIDILNKLRVVAFNVNDGSVKNGFTSPVKLEWLSY